MSKRFATLLCLALLPGPVAAQAPDRGHYDPTRAQLTRAQLQSLLDSYTQTASSGVYTVAYRARTRQEANLIRERLTNGDLQVGDKIQLTIENQQALTSTFAVQPGRALVLPSIGEIPLAGVLRSELESYLTREVGRYIVQPTVHAQSLIRITILGAVGKAGFYDVPAESLIPDALMLAGGPSGNADMKKLRITRSGRTIWDGSALQTAIADGWTLDQLSLRAGDQIELDPPSKSSVLGSVLRGAVYTLPAFIWMMRSLGIF